MVRSGTFTRTPAGHSSLSTGCSEFDRGSGEGVAFLHRLREEIHGCHGAKIRVRAILRTLSPFRPTPMELLQEFWHFITHLNETLPAFIAEHGNMVYLLLFTIIFIETGLVAFPFLPGDSLLFVAGSLAALGSLSLGGLLVAALRRRVLGDNVNYWVGRFFRPARGEVAHLRARPGATEAPGPDARLLREIRREDDHHRALRAHSCAPSRPSSRASAP
jgi:hypothetical protein